jgi:hypothetical protein
VRGPMIAHEDQVLDVPLLPEELLPGQARGDDCGHVGREGGTTRGPSHRFRYALGGIVLEAEIVLGQLLFGLLGGQGQLLPMQLVHVGPERAGLGGGGHPALPVEVLIVLQSQHTYSN